MNALNSSNEGPENAPGFGVPEKPSPFRSPPFPFERDTGSAFETALSASERTTEAIENLRGAVIACVNHLKTIGMEPEAVLVTMRAYLRHTLHNHLLAPAHDTIFESSWLSEQVARWSIEAYYSTNQQ
jgi:hypothetical protein